MSSPGTSRTSRPAKRKLGRGLGSLLAAPVAVDLDPPSSLVPPSPPPPAMDAEERAQAADAEPNPTGDDSLQVRLVEVTAIRPNPRQPRQQFDEQGIRALAESIRSAGLMQPVVVRTTTDGLELVAGERRWRAARHIGMSAIPAVVRQLDDRTATELALIENIQREDLNPIDRAEAFARLAADFDMTHLEIAECVGLDRSSITNHLRLLELDDDTRAAVQSGQLGLGHAKALLAITNIDRRKSLAAVAIRDGWSVRELERRAREAGKGRPTATPAPLSPTLEDLQRRLSEHLGTKVELRTGREKGRGRLTIHFYSLDQFDGLMRRMSFDAGE
ncbi:MAG: ParB/RepB/Spo0J family partition protein [Planctomycetota bacterium]|jgi:ParB family chromosome partitioning protein